MALDRGRAIEGGGQEKASLPSFGGLGAAGHRLVLLPSRGVAAVPAPLLLGGRLLPRGLALGTALAGGVSLVRGASTASLLGVAPSSPVSVAVRRLVPLPSSVGVLLGSGVVSVALVVPRPVSRGPLSLACLLLSQLVLKVLDGVVDDLELLVGREEGGGDLGV